jgi:hypothetical protein
MVLLQIKCLMNQPGQIRSEEASSISGINLSIPVLFNGIIAYQCPTNQPGPMADAYSHNVSCATIIKMIMNPSQISTEELSKIHAVYQAPIRQSQMKWEYQQLLLYEPIADSTIESN